MITYSDAPINSVEEINFDEKGIIRVERHGLTKREYFAAMAMQGFIASYAGATKDPTVNAVAMKSVEYADALIEQLNKEKI